MNFTYVKNGYTYNLEIYAGKQSDGPYKMNSNAENCQKNGSASGGY